MSTSKGSGEREPGWLGRQGERICGIRDLDPPEMGGRRLRSLRLVEALVVGGVRAGGAREYRTSRPDPPARFTEPHNGQWRNPERLTVQRSYRLAMDSAQLKRSSERWMNAALAAFVEGPESYDFAVHHAGVATEHLLKAYLAGVHPALIVDGRHFDSCFMPRAWALTQAH